MHSSIGWKSCCKMTDKYYMTLRIQKPTVQTELLMLYFLEPFSLTIARFILSRLGIFEGTVRTVVLWGIASIPILVFLLHAKSFSQKKYIPFVVLFFFVAIGMLVSVLLNPALSEFYTRSNYGLDRVLRPDCAMYAFLFFSLFDDPRELKKDLHIYAYIDFIYLIVVQLMPALSRGYWIDIGPNGQEMHYTYNLSFGYSMVFPTIVFLYYSIKERKLIHILFSLAGMWCIITQGNRGSLLLPIIFVGLMTINGIIDSKDMSRKALKIIGVVLVVIVIASVGESLLNRLLEALSGRGISSRTIQTLLAGSFSNDNGRTVIWLAVLKAIREGGPLGYGILGDRPFVFPIHYVGYSHNVFLELICSLGIIGVIFSIYIIIDAIRMIFFCKDTEWRELYIILFSVSCQLMLSMSFWYVWEFWAAVAIAYKYRKTKMKEMPIDILYGSTEIARKIQG